MGTSEYIPFGDEWKKSMRRLTKEALIEMIALQGRKKREDYYNGFLVGLNHCKTKLAQGELTQEGIKALITEIKERIGNNTQHGNDI